MNKNKEKIDKWMNRDTEELFAAILKLKNLSQAKMFFRDLLTEKEIIEFGQRWKVARMLARRVSYVKIAKETGMSSTTIARVHKWLQKGAGGYRLILSKTK